MTPMRLRVRPLRGGMSPVPLAILAGVSLVAAVAPQAAHAQTPFHAIRPENGATVRETVRIQFARKALDEAGVKYLVIRLDGKFREALAVFPAPASTDKAIRTPSIEVTDRVVNVLWNTKSQSDNGSNDKESGMTGGVADGPHKIEIIAEDAGGKRLGVQALDLNVDNAGGMQIPAGGLPLAYRFQVGDLSTFHEEALVEYLGERKAPVQTQIRTANGPGRGVPFGGGIPDDGSGGGGFGRFGAPGGNYSPDQYGPFTVMVQNVRAKFERTTEDNLGNGAFFVRDKALKGVIISGNGSAAHLEDVYNFKSRYRTVLTSGDITNYGVANAAHPGAYIALLIPNLGSGSRRIGQSWRVRTPVSLEWATLDKPPYVFATNTLESLEWQNGFQTARIKQSFSGKADMPIYGGAGVMKQASVQMDRTIWFAYKSGKLIRMETDVTVEGPAPAAVLSAMVPSAGINGTGGPGGFGDMGDGMGMPSLGSFQPPPGFGGLTPNGGFGGLQQQNQTEPPKAPAKFHAHSVVTLDLPGQR